MLRTVSLPKRLVPLRAASAHTGLGVKTLRNWIIAGQITGYRRGPKLIFVDLDEIDSMTRPVTARASGQ